MFCPSCGRQNAENLVFCQYCGKALPKRESIQAIAENPYSVQAVAEPAIQKERVSFRTIKAIVTVAMLAILTFVVLLMFYPQSLPWNW